MEETDILSMLECERCPLFLDTDATECERCPLLIICMDMKKEVCRDAR